VKLDRGGKGIESCEDGMEDVNSEGCCGRTRLVGMTGITAERWKAHGPPGVAMIYSRLGMRWRYT